MNHYILPLSHVDFIISFAKTLKIRIIPARILWADMTRNMDARLKRNIEDGGSFAGQREAEKYLEVKNK
jgi:hypothetical protein